MATLDAAYNRGLTVESSAEEWGRLGPLAAKTPADVRNTGAEARQKRTKANNTGRRSEANEGNHGTERATGNTGHWGSARKRGRNTFDSEMGRAMQEVL